MARDVFHEATIEADKVQVTSPLLLVSVRVKKLRISPLDSHIDEKSCEKIIDTHLLYISLTFSI